MGGLAAATRELAGWGRRPSAACRVYRPEKRADLGRLLAGDAGATLLARGLGRSYGDAGFNPGGTVDMARLDRMVAFDPVSGELECEAGVSLAAILRHFVPRGWFLPVTPGTKFVTVGGAIANDVHGKNHHADGTFGQHVRSFDLLTPAGDLVACTPDGPHADLFWATVGGVGLTGFIVTARVRLIRIASAWMTVDYRRTKDIHETMALIAENDARYKYSVAWVDCLARGKRLGRCVLMLGEHAPADGLAAPYAVRPRGQKRVPVDFPQAVLNPFSIGAFNQLFYRMHPSREGVRVDYDRYFYPLDAVLDWNRMYGRRGFAQYQATFPDGAEEGLVKLLEKLSASRMASFLGVLKRMGPGNRGLLSHPIEGFTLTLDVSWRPGLDAFLHECDDLLLEHGGRLYLAKDGVAKPETIAAMYPELDRFRAIQARVDPHGRMASHMARRLRLTEALRDG